MKRLILSMLALWVVSLDAYNAYQADQVLQALAQNKKLNCSGCDFRGLGTLFKQKKLSNMNLSGVLFGRISDTALPAASLIKIPNQVSDLTKVNFAGSTLVSTSFEGSILKYANFANADIAYANFSQADLTGVIGLDQAKNSSLASFAGAIMPDGSQPTGTTWTSAPSKNYPMGKVFYLRNK